MELLILGFKVIGILGICFLLALGLILTLILFVGDFPTFRK